ncbi:MAG: ACT domain-containing protein, partial [Candidatus Sumerlaeota bacterium]|nr:ACT domain-containing protein [Candidatus Sumerlaeota bacterium]
GMLLSDEAGNARVLPAAYERLRHLRDRPGLLLFPGFYGYTPSGSLVTFPRGGTDITGSVLAAAMEADLYENFTDVDSVYAADPRLVDSPAPIGELTYAEMRELAYAGFGVFHDEALEPVFRAEIPVRIANTNNPEAPGTRLVPRRETPSRRVVGIAASLGFCSIFLSKYLMNREVGFGRRLLQIIEEAGLSYEHCPSSIDSISVILDSTHLKKAAEKGVLERIRAELAPDRLDVEHGFALVTVVGEGMRFTVGLASRATTALAKAGVNIEMMNQGSSEINMMFGIRSDDIKKAVNALYDEFFRNGS